MAEKRASSYFDGGTESKLVDDPMNVLLSTEYSSHTTSKEVADDSSDEWEELPATSSAEQVSFILKPKRSSQREQDQKNEIILMRKLEACSKVLKRCDDIQLQGLALSCLPNRLAFYSESGSGAVDYLGDLLAWFRQSDLAILISEFNGNSSASRSDKQIETLATLLESVGIATRIVMHLSPRILQSALSDVNNNVSVRDEALSNPNGESNKKRRSTQVDSKVLKKPKLAQEDASENIHPFGCTEGKHLWLEVFLEQENSWIAVDPDSLETTSTMESLCKKLVFVYQNMRILPAFIVGFYRDGKAMDITARYIGPNSFTSTRKERNVSVDHELWWKKIMDMFTPSKDEVEVNAMIASSQVPTTIAALKSHPLYVLARDIRKYEAIYPKDTPPISQVRSESVFLRSSVHMLHTREKWLLEGRKVRENEHPYKVVLKRSVTKQENSSNNVALYGEWQTELYTAPIVGEDDPLPKNSYGNIEVFKPWMVPTGCCHLTSKGIHSTAARLGVEHAPAMIGWSFQGKTCYPIVDGIVVRESMREILSSAWSEEQALKSEEYETSISMRAVSNWRRLVKSLLLKERLRRKYLDD